MDDALVKKPSALATVVENELPQSGSPRSGHESDHESRSGSVVEKDNASASGSSSSEELLFVDESVAAKPPSDNVSGPTPFGRSAMLPPRAPVCPGDPDVEGVLPSQPSIIRRMQETNKPYVDPKDARALLPGVLFNSNSLDLDGVLDGMEAQNANRVQEKKLQEEVLLGLLRQRELENLYLAQQQRQQQELLMAVTRTGLDLELLTALNEQCRVSPPGFPQQQFKQEPASNNLLLQQMMNKPRHGRSVSDPTFAFADALNSMPPPFQPSPQVDTAATTPVVDQSDALAFLNLPNFQQQPDWTAQDVQRQSMQPNLGSLFSMPNSMKPDVPKMDSTAQKRRGHRHSKSVDLQNKARNGGSYSIRDRGPPLAPASGSKSTTRAEVKKMVQQQAALGRPTYAPWFRDKTSRNNKESDMPMPMEMPPSHHRSQSLPQVYTAPGSPEKKQETQQPASKTGKAGTGVFLPRMPVSN